MQASEPLRMPASLANPTGSSSGVPATPQNAWAEPNERWTVIENQARGIGDLKKAQPATSAAALQN